ncbi:unnamed protein product [Spirodela intermedia]|uniref:DEUBAD domain-containing protein n=1 Tax=Spirodela intermedia TaxID=51605 RepID=A0A7I8JIH2_SPIIN|nr:unnamed protein product [Spirodela intermedia]CAA6669343.1 unnamed protein product [Spirodela intermedia]
MGSDDYDVSELGEAGSEYCQVGSQNFLVPLELYDLPDLSSILSLDTWNNCLTEDERFSLAEYLPDMDQETYSQTIRELLSGSNFHFSSPLSELFSRMKGGLCEPRVDLHRRCLNFFQRSEHYHQLQKYQNSMVDSLVRMRNAWENYTGYGIEERLRLLNILRSQRPMGHSKNLNRDSATDSENDLYPIGHWDKKGRHSMQLLKSTGSGMALEATKPQSFTRRLGAKHRPSASPFVVPRRDTAGFDSGASRRGRTQKNYVEDDHAEEQLLEIPVQKRSRGSQKLGKEAIPLGRHKKGARHPVYDESLDALPPYEQRSWDSPDKGTHGYLQRSMPRGDRPTQLAGRESSLESQPQAEALSVEHDLRGKTKNRRGEGGPKIKARRPLLSHMDEQYSLSGDRAETPARAVKKISEEPGSDSSKLGEDDMYLNPVKKKKSRRPGGLLVNGESKAAEVTSRGSKIKRNVKKNRRKQSPYLDQAAATIVPDTDAPLNGKYSNNLDGAAENLPASGKLSGDPPDGRKLTKRRKLLGGRGDGLGLAIIPDMLSVEPEGKTTMVGSHYSVSEENLGLVHHEDGLADEGLADGGLRSTDVGQVQENNADESIGPGLDYNGKSNVTLAGCNSATKRRRRRAGDDSHTNPPEEAAKGDANDDPGRKKKKRKRRAVSAAGSLSLASPGAAGAVMAEEDPLQAEPEPSPVKKPFTLITPSVHTGFSFSVVHLLSAIRKAMISTSAEDMDEDDPKNLPSLTVQEIVNRVRTNPGDPCILETQEPLQDLVRGVLKILSSKTAPLGAKAWKPLEETSSEAWGIPHKMLVKLVDAFANWLKSGQETLKQIGSLPAPPALPPPNLDEKERFKDLRAQKSLVTISPSSDEARAYFRQEELLRYSVPDRAFSYTAADGRKSTVAPLRRGGGKPTSKARDHFMLKQDRPPHVTILCLVRDAAARLPGSIGTRADVSTLMRDSQFLVEDVPDGKINSVVSGALDRLHYEQDPCVQYDGERKLWVYLHRDREEEDFEDDATASKKKWKRPRRGDHGAAAAAAGELAAGFDEFSPPPPLFQDEMGDNMEESLAPLIESIEKGAAAAGEGHPMGWEVLGVGSAAAEERMVCRENSTNEDFEDEGFGAARERPAGLVSTSLLF